MDKDPLELSEMARRARDACARIAAVVHQLPAPHVLLSLLSCLNRERIEDLQKRLDENDAEGTELIARRDAAARALALLGASLKPPRPAAPPPGDMPNVPVIIKWRAAP